MPRKIEQSPKSLPAGVQSLRSATRQKHREANAEARATGRSAPDVARRCRAAGTNLCGRRQNPAALSEPPLPARGPARLSGSIHSFRTRDCRSPAPLRRKRRELRGRAAGPGPPPAPRVQATPRFPPRRRNRSHRGPHRSRARARSPQLRPLPGSRQSLPRPRPHRPLVRRSEAAGSLPGAPSSAPDFLAAEARPFSAMPRRGLSEAAEGSGPPRGPAPPEDESRDRVPKPAWAVTLMILRGSPAILSDPEFGLWSCLRLRSPHARVEVPGSTSGERRRARPPARRCLRRGPSGNVVPARTRASDGLPSDLAAPSPALPAPTPAGVGGSDAPRRGRD